MNRWKLDIENLPKMKPNGLPRHEKLKSRTAIDVLFRQGQRFSVFPVLTWHRFTPAEKGGLKVGFSCSKKHFKKAVDRNRVKRLLREAYRLQKTELLAHASTHGLEGDLFFVYVDKVLPRYQKLYEAVGKSLRQLKKMIHEKPD